MNVLIEFIKSIKEGKFIYFFQFLLILFESIFMYNPFTENKFIALLINVIIVYTFNLIIFCFMFAYHKNKHDKKVRLNKLYEQLEEVKSQHD